MKHCIACGRKLPKQHLFELKGAPASAQDIPDQDGVGADRGVELALYQCAHCGLVQFACGPVSYYRDVIRAGGYSTTMTTLRRCQYRHLIDTYHLEGKRFLEVGCGRGEFLQVLTEFPVEAAGMEHKEDLVEIACREGLHVWRDFPEQKEVRWPEGPYDVFLSFNFLEHQPHPDVMLQAIRNNLSEEGMGLVTVPSLEYILEKGSYYELIRDHIAYYSFDTLRNLLNRNGFQVLEEELVNRDTISMIVKKETGWSGDGACPEPAAMARPVSVESIVEGYRMIGEELAQLGKELKRENRRLAVWGAGHQGFTLAATTVLGSMAEYIIDSAPFKQGRFAPASHLPIVSPEDAAVHPVDAILIVAPGYTEEIAGIIRERFGADIQVMTLRSNHIERL